MRLRDLRRGREPDLIFIAKEHLERLTATFLDGIADIAIEIVSPESIARDRGDKFVEYEAAEVHEYWLIDPQRGQADFYLLGADQQYHLVPVAADGILRSKILDGFYLSVDWLWQKPLPKVTAVLKEMNLI